MLRLHAPSGARVHGSVRAAFVFGLVLPACAEDELDNPYAPGDSSYAPPLEDGGEDGDSGPDLPSEDDPDDSTTGGWDGGDENGDDDGGTATGGTTGGTTGTSGGGACAQPGSGTFAHCVDPATCGGPPCFQIQQDGMVIDGFCTVLCTNASECGPAPGNCSATPACVPVGGQSACALSCVGGASCPAGMQCMNLKDSGEVCV